MITPEPAQRKCTECDFTTSTKGKLNEHYKVVHGGTRFKCDKCSYEGTQKDKLERPMETEHGTVLYWCNFTVRDEIKVQPTGDHEGK